MFAEVVYNGGSVDDGGGITSFAYPGALPQTHLASITAAGLDITPTVDSAGTHGFLESGGSFYSVNDPNAAGTVAFGINNVGEIVGYYNDSNGVDHGFTVSAADVSAAPVQPRRSFSLVSWDRAARAR
jgi:probable HAF family extracellular repeat protein